MTDDWSGWNPHAGERKASISALTPLQRLEWLEQTLLLWGPERLAAERARRQRDIDRRWASSE
jgi:hypothetical protein